MQRVLLVLRLTDVQAPPVPDQTSARHARFEALAAEVWEPLQRFLARRAEQHDAEDVLSEVLLVLWRRLDDVPADGALPWSYAVAHRCLANARRGQERRLTLLRRLRDEPPLPTAPDADPALAAALARLRATDQEVLRLWAWEGLEPKDIAVVLGLTANAAAVRLSRARSALRNELGKDPAAAGQKAGREEEVPGR
jgi:RNA polymerase sigma-70 factor (ECF subfamily)